MGYHTDYKLESSDGISHEENVGALSGYGNQLWEESWKWYDHQEHMLEYSLKYPDVEFVLDGVGENSTDVWRKWFKNGRMQQWIMPEPEPPESPPKSWDEVE